MTDEPRLDRLERIVDQLSENVTRLSTLMNQLNDHEDRLRVLEDETRNNKYTTDALKRLAVIVASSSGLVVATVIGTYASEVLV